MRKITTAIFLLIACVKTLNAGYVTQQNCIANVNQLGCYDDPNNGPSPCPAGQFGIQSNDGQGDFTCQYCDSSESGAENTFVDNNRGSYKQHINDVIDSSTQAWTWDPDTIGATDQNSCKWITYCKAGEYFNPDNIATISTTCQPCNDHDGNYDGYAGPNKAVKYTGNLALEVDNNIKTGRDGFCYKCQDQSGQNSHNNDSNTNCECNKGYRVTNQNNNYDNSKYTDINNFRADTYTMNYNKCSINKYKVSIYKLCDDNDPPQTFSLDHGQSIYDAMQDAMQSASYVQPTRTGYHIEDQDKDTYLDKANPDNTLDITKIQQPEIRAQTYELCPIWTANTLYIEYEPGKYDENTPANFDTSTTLSCADQNYKTTEKCIFTYDSFLTQNGKEHKIPNETPSASNPSYVFMGWSCSVESSNTKTECAESVFSSNNDTITINDKQYLKPNANITNATTIDDATIVLTAQWQLCPEGHYNCTAGNPKGTKCPAGSTSAPGATSINDCFITNDTQFCDKDGKSCFKLNICTQTDDGTWKDCPKRNNSQTTN